MAGSRQGPRIEALENSHRDMHAKLDQIVVALGGVGGQAEAGGQIVPGTFDAYGRPVVALMGQQAQANPAGANAETLRLLLPLVQRAQQQPKSFDWGPVLIAILPALVERLFDRPDPIEQIAAMKELMDPGMGEQLMGMMMPMMMAKMAGGGPPAPQKTPAQAQPTNGTGGMHAALQDALDSLSEEDLATLAKSQAGPDGEAFTQ